MEKMSPKKICPEKMRMETADMTAENREKIKALFPNVITEKKNKDGKLTKSINFELLRQELSADIVDNEEAYEFTWVGKNASIVEAHKPIRKTLRPCKEESKDWDNTENLYIEGDNLEVLKLLQESYLGKVKMIYIDPPYNTGNDFVYSDNFTMNKDEYEEEIEYHDEDGNINFRQNAKTNPRFHSDWCSMIYPRLKIARNLLRDDGVIFISIDDNEVHNLRKICDEVFGAGNFIAQIVWQSTPGSNTGTNIITVTEYILVYSKSINLCLFNTIPVSDESKYIYEDEYVKKRGKYVLNKLDRRMTGSHYSEALNYPIKMSDGKLVYPGSTEHKNNENWNYRWSNKKVAWGVENGFIVFKQINGKWNAYFKQYFKVDNNDLQIKRSLPYQNLIKLEQFNSTQGTKEIMRILGNKHFDYPKPSGLLKYLLTICPNNNDIILDFFSGSSTTAHAVMKLNAEDGGNRKFIMVQLPEECDAKSEAHKAGYENICEIGKERIRRAGEKILSEHVSLQSKEEQEKQKEKTQASTLDTLINVKIPLDIGFRVFKVDDSNMKDVFYGVDDYNQNMLQDLDDNIKADRNDLDLLYGVLLEWGFPLSMSHAEEKIENCTVYTIQTDDIIDLVACFEKEISEDLIRIIAKRKPLKAVFRDSSFNTSAERINLEEIFKLYSLDTSVKVL